MINFTEEKNMRHFGIVMCVALFLTACGDSKPPAATGGKAPDATQSKAAVAPKGGAEKLAVKVGGKDIAMDVKAAIMRIGEQKASDPKNSHAKYIFVLANYETKQGSDFSKTLSDSQDVRVAFNLLGPATSGKDTPLAVGAYSTEGGWPKFDNGQYAILTVADGKQVVAMGQDFPDNVTKGEVKITSVEGDTVKGEINIVTADKNAIKGGFTAKIKPSDY